MPFVLPPPPWQGLLSPPGTLLGSRGSVDSTAVLGHKASGGMRTAAPTRSPAPTAEVLQELTAAIQQLPQAAAAAATASLHAHAVRDGGTVTTTVTSAPHGAGSPPAADESPARERACGTDVGVACDIPPVAANIGTAVLPQEMERGYTQYISQYGISNAQAVPRPAALIPECAVAPPSAAAASPAAASAVAPQGSGAADDAGVEGVEDCVVEPGSSQGTITDTARNLRELMDGQKVLQELHKQQLELTLHQQQQQQQQQQQHDPLSTVDTGPDVAPQFSRRTPPTPSPSDGFDRLIRRTAEEQEHAAYLDGLHRIMEQERAQRKRARAQREREDLERLEEERRRRCEEALPSRAEQAHPPPAPSPRPAQSPAPSGAVPELHPAPVATNAVNMASEWPAAAAHTVPAASSTTPPAPSAAGNTTAQAPAAPVCTASGVSAPAPAAESPAPSAVPAGAGAAGQYLTVAELTRNTYITEWQLHSPPVPLHHSPDPISHPPGAAPPPSASSLPAPALMAEAGRTAHVPQATAPPPPAAPQYLSVQATASDMSLRHDLVSRQLADFEAQLGSVAAAADGVDALLEQSAAQAAAKPWVDASSVPGARDRAPIPVFVDIVQEEAARIAAALDPPDSAGPEATRRLPTADVAGDSRSDFLQPPAVLQPPSTDPQPMPVGLQPPSPGPDSVSPPQHTVGEKRNGAPGATPQDHKKPKHRHSADAYEYEIVDSPSPPSPASVRARPPLLPLDAATPHQFLVCTELRAPPGTTAAPPPAAAGHSAVGASADVSNISALTDAVAQCVAADLSDDNLHFGPPSATCNLRYADPGRAAVPPPAPHAAPAPDRADPAPPAVSAPRAPASGTAAYPVASEPRPNPLVPPAPAPRSPDAPLGAHSGPADAADAAQADDILQMMDRVLTHGPHAVGASGPVTELVRGPPAVPHLPLHLLGSPGPSVPALDAAASPAAPGPAPAHAAPPTRPPAPAKAPKKAPATPSDARLAMYMTPPLRLHSSAGKPSKVQKTSHSRARSPPAGAPPARVPLSPVRAPATPGQVPLDRYHKSMFQKQQTQKQEHLGQRVEHMQQLLVT